MIGWEIKVGQLTTRADRPVGKWQSSNIHIPPERELGYVTALECRPGGLGYFTWIAATAFLFESLNGNSKNQDKKKNLCKLSCKSTELLFIQNFKKNF